MQSHLAIETSIPCSRSLILDRYHVWVTLNYSHSSDGAKIDRPLLVPAGPPLGQAKE
jgi:hypothetical protein